MAESKSLVKRSRTKTDHSKIERSIIQISNLKKKKDAILAQIAEEEKALLPQLEKCEGEVLEVKNGTEVVRAIVVRGDSVDTDEDVLRRKVGATKWKTITSLHIDKVKLGEAIKTGAVSEVDVAAASTLTPRKPFVKVTRK